MTPTNAFSLAAATFLAAASPAGIAQSSTPSGAADGARADTHIPPSTGSSHWLIVVPTEADIGTDFAKGCWVRLYDGKKFLGAQLMLVGPLQLPTMGATSPWWRRWNSLVTGTRARITIYSDPNHQGRMASFEPGQRNENLGDKEIGWLDKIESARVQCSAG